MFTSTCLKQVDYMYSKHFITPKNCGAPTLPQICHTYYQFIITAFFLQKQKLPVQISPRPSNNPFARMSFLQI